jgi:type IV secretion system protein VirB10
VLLSSFITAGANLVADSDENGFTEDLGDAAAQQAVTIGGEIVRRQLDVQPTITIRPGFKLNILVNRDMVFPEPYRR